MSDTISKALLIAFDSSQPYELLEISIYWNWLVKHFHNYVITLNHLNLSFWIFYLTMHSLKSIIRYKTENNYVKSLLRISVPLLLLMYINDLPTYESIK